MSKFKEEYLKSGYTDGYKKEVLDQTPISVPLDCKTPESLSDMINRIVNSRFYDQKTGEEFETFEEADDFDCDDDFDPSSPWEEVFNPHTGDSLGFLDQNRYQKQQWYAERRVNDAENERDLNSSGGNASKSSDETLEADQ